MMIIRVTLIEDMRVMLGKLLYSLPRVGMGCIDKLRGTFWIATIIVFMVAGCSGSLFAWGVTGHRVVGALAERHLTEPARIAVREILSGYALQDVSTWMDDIKSERDPLYQSVYGWHFMDLPNPDSWRMPRYYPDSGSWPRNLQQSLRYVIALLKNREEGGTFSQAIALRMLVHLVADAHQPLHVGNGIDRGGNRCYVKWFYSKWPSSLHAVWDSKIVDFTKYSYTEYTDFLDHVDDEDVVKWQSDAIETWLLESRRLHDSVYPRTADTNPSEYCNKDRKKVKSNKMPVLSYEYVYTMRPIVDRRLQQAGIRLAGILNEVYSDGQSL